MAKATLIGIPARLPMQLEMTPEEYEMLFLVLRHISGSANGPRRHLTSISNAIVNATSRRVDTYDLGSARDEAEWAATLEHRAVVQGNVSVEKE